MGVHGVHEVHEVHGLREYGSTPFPPWLTLMLDKVLEIRITDATFIL